MKQAILKGSINISSRPSKMILPALELGLALGSGVLCTHSGFKAKLIRQFPSPQKLFLLQSQVWLLGYYPGCFSCLNEITEWLFNLEKAQEGIKEDLINVYKYLKREWNKEGDRFFQCAQWQDKRWQAQTKTHEILSKHKESLLCVFTSLRVMKYCNISSWEVMDSPSLEIFRSRLDMVLVNQL